VAVRIPSRRTIIVGVVIAAIVIAIGMLWSEAPVVETAVVSKRNIREFISEDAKTRLSNMYTVDMPVSGTLERITLEEGDAVTNGQIVAHVDPFDLEQAVARTEAEIRQLQAQIEGVGTTKPKPEDIDAARTQVKQAADAQSMAAKGLEIGRINLENAKTEFERYKKLLEQKAVSRSAYDEADRVFRAGQEEAQRLESALQAAKSAHATAEFQLQSLVASIDDNDFMRKAHEASIQGLQAMLAGTKDKLSKTNIASPIDGVVLEKLVDSRRVLLEGTPVLTIGNPDDIEIEVDLLSEDVPRVPAAAAVEVLTQVEGEAPISGEVKRIYPSGFKKISSLGIEQQRVKVIVSFDNSVAKLRPGSSVDVRIITSEAADVLSVPDMALFREGGAWNVFEVRGGRVYKTAVTPGVRNDQWAEIREGLNAGTVVVVEGATNVTDQQKVTAHEVMDMERVSPPIP
jgi:HlyD family secretion protein